MNAFNLVGDLEKGDDPGGGGDGRGNGGGDGTELICCNSVIKINLEYPLFMSFR